MSVTMSFVVCTVAMFMEDIGGVVGLNDVLRNKFVVFASLIGSCRACV